MFDDRDTTGITRSRGDLRASRVDRGRRRCDCAKPCTPRYSHMASLIEVIEESAPFGRAKQPGRRARIASRCPGRAPTLSGDAEHRRVDRVPYDPIWSGANEFVIHLHGDGAAPMPAKVDSGPADDAALHSVPASP